MSSLSSLIVGRHILYSKCALEISKCCGKVEGNVIYMATWGLLILWRFYGLDDTEWVRHAVIDVMLMHNAIIRVWNVVDAKVIGMVWDMNETSVAHPHLLRITSISITATHRS